MAYTIDAQTHDQLTVREFVDYVDRCVDVDDVDSLLGAAPAFKALLNNRTLISDLIERELRSWRDFQDGNSYVSTTLILARTPRYFLRANVWLPERDGKRPRGDAAIYGLTHDHNFTFMTGGYQGAGYTTEIFGVDGRAAGLRGERVKLEFLERTTLPPGKIMLYRAVHDVHRQSRPHELSVSVNLVVPTHSRMRPQYFFDLNRGTITHTEYPEHGRTLALMRLARYAGNTRTGELLRDIAETSKNPRLRSAAYESLCECEAGSANDVRERLLVDSDPHVRTVAQKTAPKVPAFGGPPSH